MSERLKTVFRRSLWAAAFLVLVAGALWLAEPFIPTKVMFGTEDAEARSKYESIVSERGYSFSHEKNVHGETLVVIDDITPREYHKIDCAYFAWSAEMERNRGVIVYERPECAL